MFASLFKKKEREKAVPPKKGRKDVARYEEEKQIVKSEDTKAKRKLAKDPKTHLEILYYLASDEDAQTRLSVAQNESTPLQASGLIAKDEEIDVRLALMKRLVDLLPSLSEDQYAHLYAFAAQALGVLALDEVLKVRLALSSALKDHAYAPPEVASKLARDLERKVSEPILRFCSAVPDEVLIEILNEHPSEWVIEAIAERDLINEGLSMAIIETGHVKGGQKLLNNENAKISDETYLKITDKARETPEWHKPLAMRRSLPREIIQAVLLFVDQSLQKTVLANSDLDEETQDEIRVIVKRRASFMVESDGSISDPRLKAHKLYKQEQLDSDAVGDALALREYDFVTTALSLLAEIPEQTVQRIFETKSPKAIVSVVWKAGLNMRLALEIQKQMAKVPFGELIYPKNGEDYPMTKSDMQWQIEFFEN